MGILKEIQARATGGLEMPIQQEAHGTKIAFVATCGETGIVGDRGISADGDGGKEPTEAVDVGLRLRTRDRPALPRGQGQLTVERRGDLERDQGRAADDPMIEEQIQCGALLSQDPFDDRDTLGAKQFEAVAGVGRIRIARADDDRTDAGSQDGVDAGRRAAVRAARLQRDVQDGVRGGLTA